MVHVDTPGDRSSTKPAGSGTSHADATDDLCLDGGKDSVPADW